MITTKKLSRIIFLALVDCLFAALVLASTVHADQQEDDFRTQCTQLGGSIIKSDSSSACPDGHTQLASAYLSQQWINIFCCEGNTTEVNPGLEINLEQVDQLKAESLDQLNPLRQSQVLGVDSTPGDIINRAMSSAIFPIAGIALLILIIWGGFQMVTASFSGKANYVDLGKQKVVAAVIGFLLLFVSFWIWQAVTLALGIQ